MFAGFALTGEEIKIIKWENIMYEGNAVKCAKQIGAAFFFFVNEGQLLSSSIIIVK